jgi:L-threonylcarbamoyladenylate synthase
VDSAPLIRNLKGRGEDKPFIIYILEPRDIAVYSPADPSQPILSLWPGPLTLILPALGEGTVALRCPADPWVRRVLELCGFGIYTTSVNRSGRPAMGRIGEIIAEFGSSVDLIIDGGDMEGGLPSTIVDACEKPYRVLRQGELAVPGELLV